MYTRLTKEQLRRMGASEFKKQLGVEIVFTPPERADGMYISKKEVDRCMEKYLKTKINF